MKIHEYQAKSIFEKSGIKVPNGILITKLNELNKIKKRLKYPLIAKVQIHAGGRGKSGGVILVNSFIELKQFAKKMLNKYFKTYQSNIQGQKVSAILLENFNIIKKEFYLGITIDREKKKTCIIISKDGGTDIESSKNKNLSITEWINPLYGLTLFQTRNLCFFLSNDKNIQVQIYKIIQNSYRIFMKNNLILLEINPLVINSNNNVVAVDAKMEFDDNAEFKHKYLSSYKDDSQEDSKETVAKKINLNYIALNGDIGCMVNGAGLAMATMDMINHFGGNPANFLDVGGNVTRQTVKKAIKIILLDENVRSIFINIFGGIVKCDIIARGIIDTLNEIHTNIKILVRLNGTNAKKAIKMLNESNLNIKTENDFEKATKKIIKMTRSF